MEMVRLLAQVAINLKSDRRIQKCRFLSVFRRYCSTLGSQITMKIGSWWLAVLWKDGQGTLSDCASSSLYDVAEDHWNVRQRYARFV